MQNIERLLAEKGIYACATQGNSMEPMLREGRDRVIITRPEFPLKKYDVPVYRRDGHYTMHRIVWVTKKGYIICGDNRAVLEKDITDKDIVGVLEGYYRGDEYISCEDKEYLRYVKSVCRKYPIRLAKYITYRITDKIKRMIKTAFS